VSLVICIWAAACPVGGADHFCPFITGIIPQPNWAHVPNTHAPHSLTWQSQYPSTFDGRSQQVFLTITAFPSPHIPTNPSLASQPHRCPRRATGSTLPLPVRRSARLHFPCLRLSVQSPPTTSSANLISPHLSRSTSVIARPQITAWGGKRSIRGNPCLGTAYRLRPTQRL
jgi:hypothetical protein